MRAAVVTSDAGLRIENVPAPVPEDDEMLLRTRLCGLCGSDLYKLRNRTAAPGTVLGHETVAMVEKCPDSYASQFPVGSRVTVSNHVPCGQCPACSRGRISMCDQFRSTHLVPGGFAELIKTSPAHLPHAVIRLPETLSDEQAILAEPLGCALRAVERWGPRFGDTIHVVGLGPMGILIVLLLKRSGMTVLGIDPLEARRAFARQKGCDGVVPPESVSKLPKAEGAILTVCSASVLETALAAMAPGGWVGVFAGPSEDVSIPVRMHALYRDEIDMIPSYSTGPAHMKQAVELLDKRVIDVDGLVSHRLAVEDIRRAVGMAERCEGMKAVLYFEDAPGAMG